MCEACLKVEVILNGWSVPMWVSVIAITAYLAFESLKLCRRKLESAVLIVTLEIPAICRAISTHFHDSC